MNFTPIVRLLSATSAFSELATLVFVSYFYRIYCTKIEVFIKGLFSKCDQICSFL